MTKKIIQIALIAAAIAVIVYAYFNISDKKETIGDPFQLITPRTALIMEITDMSALDDYQQVLREISETKNDIADVSFNPVSEWYDLLKKLDTLRANSNNWFDALSKSTVVFCSGEQGRGDVWYISAGLGNESLSDVTAMMDLWVPHGSTREFKNQKIHVCGKMQWAMLNQCLVIASTSSVIEDVVIQSLTKKADSNFHLLTSAREISSRDVPIHYYIADSNTAWLQLDPIWIEGQAVLSGYRIAGEQSKKSLSLASNGGFPEITKHLPLNTSYIDSYSYSDFETGWRIQEEYFSGSEKSRFWSQAWKDMGDSCGCDLNASLINWRSGEWGTVVITLSDSSTAEVAYFGIKDTTSIIPLLQPVLDHSPDKSAGIFKMKYPQLFERNQPEGILIEHNYLIQQSGYLFAASTPGDLRAVSATNNNLTDDDCFKLSCKPLNKTTGRFVFRKDFYAAPIPQILRQMLAGFSCISIASERTQNERVLLNLSLPVTKSDYNSTATEPATEASTNDVQEDILQGPWSVINHKTGGKEEVMINKLDELCLIGEDGKVIWKKKIAVPVLGSVVQIDALNNGKLQLAFTTESALYVIDRNGNDLAGFPFQPKLPITSPLLVADYDNNKRYRMIFATEDGSILNLNTSGKTTDGWKNPSENAVINQVQHLKTGNEDVLITLSATGKIGLYKRNGEVKDKTNSILDGYDGGPIELQNGSNLGECKIAFTNKKGEKKTVQLIN